MSRFERLRRRYHEASIEMHERRLARMNRTLPGWRDRAHRRPLVVISVVTMLAAVVVSLLAPPALGGWYLLWCGLLALWFWQWLVLRSLTSGISEATSAVLDEREKGLRDRAVRVAFITSLTLSGAVCGALGSLGTEQVTAGKLALILASVTLLWGSIPVNLLAWTLPDDDPEDLLDDTTHTDEPDDTTHADRPRRTTAGTRPTGEKQE